MSYLTFAEYTTMGGQLSQPIFNSIVMDVESKLDYLTNGRIQNFTEIPIEVKNLEFKLVTLYDKTHSDINDADFKASEISSYNNGIESITYNVTQNSENMKGSTNYEAKIIAMIKEYLWKYPELLYRGRKQYECN